MQHRSRQRGFTLVELVATTAIGTVALLGTLSAVLMGANVSRTAAETRAAARTSASMMEQIRSVPFSDLEATFDGTAHDFSSLLPSGSEGQVTVSVTTVPGSSTRWPVKQIELTAAWDGANGRRVLSFATYVSDRLATSAHSGAGYTEGEGTVASGETLQGDGTAATIYESMNTAAEGTTSTASGAGEAYTAPPETTTSSTTTSSAASTSSATSSSATSTNPNGKPTGKKK